ncbi:vWA domain-containing protein [Streptomyces profundus]|uniref:vWA domain-containing protein n=1 Tax=Streptomyces profundus TaxID=2867410 RepID=UPI001D1650D6|nr:VWA domain-containing protein [Streptomyces sp. MA3_2.13]UED85541.1 VWA domain-containing protein [Streptomyces sp. MA3_2.13]
MGAPATGRGTRRVGLLAAGLALALSAALAPPPTPANAQDDEETGAGSGVAPIDFAIVVDQSDSLSDEDLLREVDAATTIAQAELSEESQAIVIGFGSAEREGQVAAVEACQRTELDADGRQLISECVRGLARPDREVIGPGTDHPAALAQAVGRLSEGDPDTPRVIFLLTDGRLDVRDSLNYGDSPEARQNNAGAALRATLAEARANNVQVWPLGFGDQIDEAALREMAEGGYAEGCANLPDAVPEMRVVQNSGDLLDALQSTFASARCAAVQIGDKGVPPVDLDVVIPPIATDGSITVAKGAPGVRVTYLDPDGREVPRQGTFEGSTFEISGQNTAVEALRVSDPKPGTWTVHLEPAEDGPAMEAAVSAIWQGRVLSFVTVEPPSPNPGETVLVEAQLQTRENVTIDDPEQLAGLYANARLTGEGFEPVEVPLGDDGRNGDRRAGDLVFTGEITVPENAVGALAFTSEMAAPGVVADERPFPTRVTEGPPLVQGIVTVEDGELHPGGSIDGSLRIENNDGRPHELRLELRDTGEGAVRVEPPTVVAEPGSARTVPFTITFGSDVPLGGVGGTVVVVDETEGDLVVHQAFLNATVTAPPTWWDRYRWAVITGVAALAVAAAMGGAWFLARRRGLELTGHTVELGQNDRTVDQQPIRDRPRVFYFRVERGRSGHAGLTKAHSGGGSVYELRRRPSGVLRLKPPRDPARDLRPDQRFPVGDETWIVVRAPVPRQGAKGGGRNGGGGGDPFRSFLRRPPGRGRGRAGGPADSRTSRPRPDANSDF